MHTVTSLILLAAVIFVFLLPIRYVKNFAKQHQIRVGEIFGVLTAIVVKGLPFYVVGSIVLGVVSWFLVRLITLWSNTSETIALIAAVAVPFWFLVALTCKRIAKTKYVLDQSLQSLQSSLGGVDYFWTSSGSSIAVNVSKQQIALLAKPQDSVKLILMSNVKSAAAVQPELNQIKVMGATGIGGQDARLDAARENFQAKIDNVQDTGLQLLLDDLQIPRVHIMMPFSGAEQWMVALEQMQRGVLQIPATTQRLPAV